MKEVFDVVGQLNKLRLVVPWAIDNTPDYQLLRNAVRVLILSRKDSEDIKGFQFMVALEVGGFVTDEHRLDYVSSYEPLRTSNPHQDDLQVFHGN